MSAICLHTSVMYPFLTVTTGYLNRDLNTLSSYIQDIAIQ